MAKSDSHNGIDLNNPILQALARIRGDKTLLGSVDTADLFSVSASIIADARQQEEARKKAEEENLKPGNFIAGQGIYLGKYHPKDHEGKYLGKTFNIFAAPKDLPTTMRYFEAVDYISRLKNWHRFDGTNYATDREIYAALKDGSYNGGWIIPPRDILRGNDLDGNATVSDSLFEHRKTKAFNGTFTTTDSGGIDYAHCYWSSTASTRKLDRMWNIRLSNGEGGYFGKTIVYLSCRPVRLVEVKP